MRRWLIPVCALLAACGTSQAAIHPSLAAALKLHYTPGQTLVYALGLNMKLNEDVPSFGAIPIALSMRGTETEKVTSVAKDGTASLDVTLSGLTGTVNGKPLPAQNPPTVHMQIAPDGRIVAGGSSGLGGVSLPGGDQLTPLLPSDKVKPGDTWTRDYTRPNPFGSGTLSVTSQNKYLRNETIGGVTYAVVETNARIPLNVTIDLSKVSGLAGSSGHAMQGTASYSGTISLTDTSWIGTTTQSLYKVVADMTMDADITVPGSNGGPIHMAGTFGFNLERQ